MLSKKQFDLFKNEKVVSKQNLIDFDYKKSLEYHKRLDILNEEYNEKLQALQDGYTNEQINLNVWFDWYINKITQNSKGLLVSIFITSFCTLLLIFGTPIDKNVQIPLYLALIFGSILGIGMFIECVKSKIKLNKYNNIKGEK